MEIRRELPASPAAGALAREALDGWLADIVGRETAADVRLAASELIGNVVLHAGLTGTDTIRLSGLATEDILRIEVEQASSAADAHIVAVGERTGPRGGFGLRIVEEVASDWGVRGDPPGAVWFEVDRDPPQQ